MLTVIEEYSTYYPQEGRGHVRLKVQPARGRACAAPRCKPRPAPQPRAGQTQEP